MLDKNFEFVFETFEDAMNVHKKLFKIMRETHFVSYADVYEAINGKKLDKAVCSIHDFIFEPNKYGWDNLLYSKVTPKNDDLGEWVLILPNKFIKKEIK